MFPHWSQKATTHHCLLSFPIVSRLGYWTNWLLGLGELLHDCKFLLNQDKRVEALFRRNVTYMSFDVSSDSHSIQNSDLIKETIMRSLGILSQSRKLQNKRCMSKTMNKTHSLQWIWILIKDFNQNSHPKTADSDDDYDNNVRPGDKNFLMTLKILPLRIQYSFPLNSLSWRQLPRLHEATWPCCHESVILLRTCLSSLWQAIW